MSVVVLFGRPGCCLCDDARVLLDRVRLDHPFEFRECDIESDERLLRSHLERIPVITLDGEELFELAIDESLLRRALAARHMAASPEVSDPARPIGLESL